MSQSPFAKLAPAREHDLWKDGDENIPYAIQDRNGQVCLAYCKVCGQAEIELEANCPGPTRRKLTNDEQMQVNMITANVEADRLIEQMKREI